MPNYFIGGENLSNQLQPDQKRRSRAFFGKSILGTASAVFVALVIGLFVGLWGPGSSAASASSRPTSTATVCGEDGQSIVRLYRAYFNRLPDSSGLRYWGGIYEDSDLETVAFWMSQSAEFQNRWRGTNARDYVERSLYNNLLRRAPERSGLNYWSDIVSDIGRDKVALYWVQQPELVGKHPVKSAPGCDIEQGPDTYQVRNIPGGKVIDVNYRNVEIGASTERCSVASINANWLDPNTGGPVGLAVVDGKFINRQERTDRGVFGERPWSGNPLGAGIIDDYSGTKQTANIFTKPGVSLHQHGDFYSSPIHGWNWAVSGTSLILDGETSSNLTPAVLQDYTHGTLRHPFIATRPDGTLTFGATTAMNVTQLMAWVRAQGYTNLIKFDGGGSVEMNINGKTAVAGTPRDIPVWFGIGCS